MFLPTQTPFEILCPDWIPKSKRFSMNNITVCNIILIDAMKTKNIISSSLLLFCILKPTLSFPSAPFRLITTRHKGRAVNFANYYKRSKSIFLKQQQEDDDHHDGNVNKSNSSSLLPEGHSLSIEYCTGCRWLLRSAWLMQELFTTFNDEMGNITLIPSKPPSPGGTFVRVLFITVYMLSCFFPFCCI